MKIATINTRMQPTVDENNRYHSYDGAPAVVRLKGQLLEYWDHGKRHRWSGPAVEYKNGYPNRYFLFGREIGEEEWQALRLFAKQNGIIEPSPDILMNIPRLKWEITIESHAPPLS